jgi:hypothetical protein
LRSFRDVTPIADAVRIDSSVVYGALGARLNEKSAVHGDLSNHELRAAFSDGEGLILAEGGWLRPGDVLDGPPIFGNFRVFLPQVPGAEPLWKLLEVRQPSLDDCLKVFSELRRRGDDLSIQDQGVMLESLRLMRDLLAASGEIPQNQRKRLKSLPLWTTRGWTNQRPVYAIDDPSLKAGLGDRVAVWDPGGDYSQFGNISRHLQITPLLPDAASVLAPEEATEDEESTELFLKAISLLEDDLTRNDPELAASLEIGWDRLRLFQVCINPDLRVVVDGIAGEPHLEVQVAAKADLTCDRLFIRDFAQIHRIEGAGRALAGLFKTSNRRSVARDWLVACSGAEEGLKAERMVPAAQRAREEAEQTSGKMEEALQDLASDIEGSPSVGLGGSPHKSNRQRREPVGSQLQVANESSVRRVLVDPQTLTRRVTIGSAAEYVRQKKPESPSRGVSSLVAPNPEAAPLRSTAQATSFTALEKETVGLEIARKVLAGPDGHLVDLRSQRGVGADAIDDLERFYELKVHLGEEPDSIRMEQSEIQRAMSTPDFFLVIVSKIEGTDARPQVRVIVDPLSQLQVVDSSSLTFSGVRTVKHSLLYQLEP